jgi:hypothetical protein
MATLLIPTDTSQATLGYLLEDGTTPLTADWDVGAFRVTTDGLTAQPTATVASASGAIWDGVDFKATTATITGSTDITTAKGFNFFGIGQPTLSASSRLKVTTAATVYIADAPTAAATLDSDADINEGGTFSAGDTTLTVTDSTKFMDSASGTGPSIVVIAQNIEIDNERLGVSAIAAKVDSTANVNDGGGVFFAGDTTLTVTDGSQFSAPSIIQINDELLRVTNVSSNDLTVVRGLLGTADVGHVNGTDVFHLDDVTVTRGEEGTTDANHNDGTDIFIVTPKITSPLALRVDAGDVSLDGNLGLGVETSTIAERLDVKGNIKLITNNDKLMFLNNASITWDGANLVFLASPGQFTFDSALNMLGNILYGNTTSGGGLTIVTTTDPTKGKIFFGATGVSVFDEANLRWGVNKASPSTTLHVGGIATFDGNIVMGDNSVTGIDTLTFTDVDGTIAGIANKNLVDKSATETVSGAWTFGPGVLVVLDTDSSEMARFVDNGIVFGGANTGGGGAGSGMNTKIGKFSADTAGFEDGIEITNEYTAGGPGTLRMFPSGSLGNTRAVMEFYRTDLTASVVNYERMLFFARASPDEFRIEIQAGGTGTLRDLFFRVGSTNVLKMDASSTDIRILTSLVVGADSVPLSTLETLGSFGATITAISSATTLDETHHVVTCDASGGAFTVTLPAASGATGRIYHIKKTDSSGNAVTVDANASETIDGDLTKVISTQYDSMMISCDGSNWHII